MQLKDLRPCALCGEATNPCFFKLSLQYLLIDQEALQRSLGMMQFFGGSVSLASVFSDARLEKPMTKAGDFVLCVGCVSVRLGELFEALEFIAAEKTEPKTDAREVSGEAVEIPIQQDPR